MSERTVPPVAARRRPPSAGVRAALLVGACAVPLLCPGQTAGDARAACGEAVGLIDAEDFDAALEEARWCVESLEQVRAERTSSVFPDAVGGFAGGELDSQGAMGMTMMSRPYTRAGDTIDVALTTGPAGGGLAALAQVGLGLGGAGGARKLRVQKRTVIDTGAAEGRAGYLVQLRSGGVLTIGSETLGAEDVLDFVRAFPIRELDETLAP